MQSINSARNNTHLQILIDSARQEDVYFFVTMKIIMKEQMKELLKVNIFIAIQDWDIVINSLWPVHIWVSLWKMW